MLVDIKDSSLSDTEKITGAFLRRYYAVDTDTGAHLSRSYGHSKSGNGPKWFLILPLDGQLFDSRAGCERATFRAWGLNEAIAIANEKLPKLLKRKAKRLGFERGVCHSGNDGYKVPSDEFPNSIDTTA